MITIIININILNIKQVHTNIEVIDIYVITFVNLITATKTKNISEVKTLQKKCPVIT